jgi:hypothetical protein
MCSKLTLVLTVFLLLTTGLFAQGVDPGTANLTHSWTFDDGTARDVVGGVDGVLVGEGSLDDKEYFNWEQDQWIELDGSAIAMWEYDEVSVEAWFIPMEGLNTGYDMLWYFGGKNTSGQGSNGLFYSPSRGDDVSRVAISCGVEESPWTGETGVNGLEIDDGFLHHMVGTLNGDEIGYYLDGALVGVAPLAANNKIELLSSDFAYLCRGGYDADPEFLGELLVCNIYNRVLTADEVLFLSLQDPTSTLVKEHENAKLPSECNLSQNYPNPFNPTTNISFYLPASSEVTISVYDLLGHEVATLVNEIKSAGQHTVQFDGQNLSNGMYLCKMNAANQVFTTKMMLLK